MSRLGVLSGKYLRCAIEVGARGGGVTRRFSSNPLDAPDEGKTHKNRKKEEYGVSLTRPRALLYGGT